MAFVQSHTVEIRREVADGIDVFNRFEFLNPNFILMGGIPQVKEVET